MQGEAGALPQVHPSAFSHVSGCLLVPGQYAALPKKTLLEAKEFAGGCGTGPSVGAPSGQRHPRGPLPGTVTQKAWGTAEQGSLVPEGAKRYLWVAMQAVIEWR